MTDTHADPTPDAHGEHAAPAASPVGPTKLTANFTAGGHEVDATPNRNLMAFLAVMVVLLILSAVGVFQLFVSHTDAQMDDAASQPSTQLADQKKRDEDFRTTYGKIEVDGKLVAYRMPFAEAKRMVLADPARFAAAPPPAGWVHPDDAAKQQAPQPKK